MHLPSRLLITCIHQEGSVLGAEPLTLLPRLSDSFLSFFLSRSCCCCGYSSKSPQICSQLRAEETACRQHFPPKHPFLPVLQVCSNHQTTSECRSRCPGPGQRCCPELPSRTAPEKPNTIPELLLLHGSVTVSTGSAVPRHPDVSQLISPLLKWEP